jgi:phage FluMu protein Com
MKVQIRCPSCARYFPFETEGARVEGSLQESRGGGGQSYFVVKCPHCGATNKAQPQKPKP